MAAQDIAAILNGLTGDFYIFQEVIDQSRRERCATGNTPPTAT